MNDVHPLRIAWWAIITLGATLVACTLPLELVFGIYDEAAFTLDLLVSFVFVIDAAITGVELIRRRAGTRRVLFWLIVDVAPAVPFGLLGMPIGLEILRLAKMARVVQYMHRWRRREMQYAHVLRLVFVVFWVALGAHWLACGWLSLRGHVADSGQINSYVVALYWTIQTLTTVGYGDVTPGSTGQMLYTIGVMILGAGVYGYVIATVANIIANIDPAKRHYRETMERVNAFMRYRRLPVPLQTRIREYYAYLWKKRLGYDESAIVADLSPTLRTDVTLYLKKDIIERVPLFNGAPEEFVKEIAMHMRPVVYLPGDVVFRAGDHGTDMFFISQGTVEVLSQDGHTVHNTLGEGEFFGEIALFLNQPRSATVRATDHCDLYRLEKDVFARIVDRFPEIARKIEELVNERKDRV